MNSCNPLQLSTGIQAPVAKCTFGARNSEMVCSVGEAGEMFLWDLSGYGLLQSAKLKVLLSLRAFRWIPSSLSQPRSVDCKHRTYYIDALILLGSDHVCVYQ